jgi:hypothetical protein
MENYIGKKCIVRCDRSGVFFGTIAEMEGQRARIANVRNIWWWEGAASVMQLAAEGTKKPDDCKFSVAVSEIVVTDVIQVIPCTNEAIAHLEAVKPWKM